MGLGSRWKTTSPSPSLFWMCLSLWFLSVSSCTGFLSGLSPACVCAAVHSQLSSFLFLHQCLMPVKSGVCSLPTPSLTHFPFFHWICIPTEVVPCCFLIQILSLLAYSSLCLFLIPSLEKNLCLCLFLLVAVPRFQGTQVCFSSTPQALRSWFSLRWTHQAGPRQGTVVASPLSATGRFWRRRRPQPSQPG